MTARQAFSDGLAPCTCEWCGKVFARKSQFGKKPRYCGRAHAQRAYEARHGIRAGR